MPVSRFPAGPPRPGGERHDSERLAERQHPPAICRGNPFAQQGAVVRQPRQHVEGERGDDEARGHLDCPHGAPAFGTAPRCSRCSSTSPMPAIVKATLSGARTGPTHGTGMRNSTSQVSREGGQPSITLSHTVEDVPDADTVRIAGHISLNSFCTTFASNCVKKMSAGSYSLSLAPRRGREPESLR